MNGRMHGRWHGPGGRGGRRPGRGGWQQADLPPPTTSRRWLSGRLPDGWFAGAPEVTVDREEILIVGELPPLEGEFADTEAGRADRAAAAAGRISRFRRVHPRRADRDRPPGRAPLPAQGRVGRAARRAGRAVHGGVGAGHDAVAAAGADRARHAGRLRGGALPLGRAGLGGAAGRQHADEWLGELREAMAQGRRPARARARRATAALTRRPVPRSAAGTGASQIATWWQIAASTVAAWKNSWKPKVFGQRVGPADGVNDRADGVEHAADEQQHERGDAPRCAGGRAARTPRPSPARRRSARRPRRARTATAS